MIAIIDYNAGNIASVARALHVIGQEYVVTDDTSVLTAASCVIFPGVGAAGEAMAYLRHKKLDSWLLGCLSSGKPLLGICLGTQIILDASEENDTQCIGLVGGTTRRFPENLVADGRRLKIPHMGWNQVHQVKPHQIFSGIEDSENFYFVHSYYVQPDDEQHVIARTLYGLDFCCAIAREELVATQFHPEKSGKNGLKVYENFLSGCSGEEG
jgi:glutamine amidotransferase